MKYLNILVTFVALGLLPALGSAFFLNEPLRVINRVLTAAITASQQDSSPVQQRSADGVRDGSTKKTEIPKLEVAVGVNGAPVHLATDPVIYHKDFINVTEYHLTNGYRGH